MTTYDIISAIAQYYGISFVEAEIRYNSRSCEDEYDQCVEWWLDQIDERG